MKIYTKTGDRGETGLFGGQRVQKNNTRIQAYGTVDELNAFIGVLCDSTEDQWIKTHLINIQHRLFSLGAYLATPPKEEKASLEVPDVFQEDIEVLEKEMDRMDAALEPLRNFILPGGHLQVSFAHLARTVCRRAEREVITLHQQETLAPLAIQYLNRLSDYFFILARYLAKELDVKEVLWEKRAR